MNSRSPTVLLPTHHTRRRCRAQPPARADVVVIGAGLGGLQAAAVLARQGLSVVVLDGHYVAGGCATMFARARGTERWVFDVGVHYVGEAGPGERIPQLLAAAGAEVPFTPLHPDGFDRVHLPGLSFTYPWTLPAFRERLVAAFPEERRGIDRYVRVLDEVERISRVMRRHDRPGPALLWHVLTGGRSLLRWRDATIGALLDHCTRDPLLRGVLLAQHGDYGVPPHRASAVAHLAVSAHYFRGGWYPRGGGQRIADALADAVEAAGGHVCLRRAAARILVEGDRAVGVETEQGDVIRADVVVSNADLKRTLLHLLPEGVLPPRERRRVDGLEMAAGIHLLCLGVRGDLRARGVRAGNDWIADTPDPAEVYAGITRGHLLPRAVCATSGSVKDAGTHGHAPDGCHTLEVMALVPGEPGAWGVPRDDVPKRRYQRSAGYQAAKAAVEERMLDLLERVYPGLRGDVVFRESASPVTHVRYTRASGGTAYGLAVLPSQFGAGRPGFRGPIPGLYLCGASTRTAHGVVGALHGGWKVAAEVCAALAVARPVLPDGRPA